MEKRYMIIHDELQILDASLFNEGVGIYMPENRGVIINTKSNLILLLTAIGVSDFSKLEAVSLL